MSSIPGSKFRIFNGFLAALFVYAAAVQFDDPDWFWWVLLYGGSAIACAWSAWGKPHAAKAHVLMAVVGLINFGSLVPKVMEAGDLSGTEIERETLGLFLVFAWHLYAFWRSR